MKQIKLVQENGTLQATYEWTTFRFLLSDGRILDVSAIHDDSHLRSAVLAHAKAERIEGVAIVPPKVEVPNIEEVVDRIQATRSKRPVKPQS